MIPAFIPNAGASIFNSAEFILPLSDAGNGAVNTTLQRGTGSATFTRATAAACRLSTGLWKLDVASGTARSHYHEFTPGVMTYGGYLAEPAATQLALLPRDMTNAAWVKGATMTVAQTGTGIDGVVNSCSRLTAGAVAGTNTVLQTLAAAATSRTYSAFIKRVTGTGTINIQQGATVLDVTALLNTTSFVQVQLNASVLNSAFGIQMATNGDVILVDCNQFEAGAIATTPIPAAGTRNADVLSYPFAGNAGVAQGTAYGEFATTFAIAAPASSVFLAFVASGLPLFVASGQAVTTIACNDTSLSALKTGLTSLATGVRKRASNWGGVTMATTGDGAAVASQTFDGSMGGTTSISVLNSNGATVANGTVKNLRIWQSKLASQSIRDMTI